MADTNLKTDTSEDLYCVADRLTEIKNKIEGLIQEARQDLQTLQGCDGRQVRRAAEAYWVPAIELACSGGRSYETTMESSIKELIGLADECEGEEQVDEDTSDE